jgi:hypothetical protein
MKGPVRLLVLAAISFLVACYAATPGFAQTKTVSETKTVTGCLQKGDEANEFSLRAEDGKRYDLRSSAVDLSKHLGHKVTVTGTFKAESYESGEKEEDKKKEREPEAGDIRVTSLKMVSDSCK